MCFKRIPDLHHDIHSKTSGAPYVYDTIYFIFLNVHLPLSKEAAWSRRADPMASEALAALRLRGTKPTPSA